MEGNEFPVCYYDFEYNGNIEGLSMPIFSSFTKLLECITHYLEQLEAKKNNEVIPDFFEIDPKGAGLTGREYWLAWADSFE
jgi:hypothetical protein